jgi:hypothetical protein
MSKQDTKKGGTHEGELSEQQLDRVSGGQEVRKMETIVVTAHREKAEPAKVVKMETIVVTAQREKPDLAGTKLASAEPNKSRK